MKQNAVELLAPAGSFEGFEAAIGAGADAVYAGGSMFGARAYAQNFTEQELLRAIDLTHIHGKKLYLAVNTLLKNKELEKELIPYLTPFYEAGLDAVIVQDYGVFRLVREVFPGLSIHASTQMTVTGPQGMAFLEAQGATRVVAARELSLKELAAMHKASEIEIEAFIHGALCYSYSGQCLMSSFLGARSGNRGRCAQPCRLPYSASLDSSKFQKGRELCPLSLKDICTLEILPEILQAGVTSLKIEGRMKQPSYTAGVTGIYRKYLDFLQEKGADEYHVDPKDKKYLLDLFNRGGSCTGYFQTAKGPEMMAFSNEKKTENVEVQLTKRKEKIYGNLILFPGSPAILEMSCRGTSVTVSGEEVQYAVRQPMEEARIRAQMEKLGNTPFSWEKLDINMDEQIFIPMGALNQMRREAVSLLEEALVRPYRREMSSLGGRQADKTAPASPERGFSQKNPGNSNKIYVSCESMDVAASLLKEKGLAGLYLPADLMEEYLEEGLSLGLEMYLALPHITRTAAPAGYWDRVDEWLQKGMTGFLVRNLEDFAQLKTKGLAEKCVLDHSLYTWNEEAQAFWKEQKILRDTIPLELNRGELMHRDNTNSEMLVYGYLPLMVSTQCVRRNLFGCLKAEKKDAGKGVQRKPLKQNSLVYLKDRYEKIFPVECYCEPWKAGNTKKADTCYNILYNTLPFGLLEEREQVQALHPAAIRLAFTIENPAEAIGIFRNFASAYHEGKHVPKREFTKGHFKRGAE